MKRLLVFALTLLLIIPSVVMAQDDLGDAIADFFGFPAEWLTSPKNIFYFFIIPFLGIWMIVLGFLQVLKIFGDSKVKYVLSLIIAFATLPTQVFVIIVSALFGFMGVWSVGAFAVMFFVGTAMYARRWIGFHRGTGHVIHGMAKEEEGILKEIDARTVRIKTKLKDPKKIDKEVDEIRKLRKKLEQIRTAKKQVLDI